MVRKQAPFLKMYSEYTNNYDRATRVFEEMKKKKKFADVVREIEVSVIVTKVQTLLEGRAAAEVISNAESG